MKKLSFILLIGLLMSFMLMQGENLVPVRKGGSLTALLAANLSVTMVLSAHRKKRALTEK